jgi:glucokinase
MSVEAFPNPVSVVADVGATNVRVALARGAVLGPIKERRIADLQLGGADGVMNGLVGLMRDAISAGFDGGPTRVVAAGIGVCAAVDDSGSLRSPLPFELPSGRGVADIVSAALGVPVAIDNDANMAALGELRHGAGRGFRDFVLITLGTNIGMGIVAGGRVLHGARGGAGEGGLMLTPAQSLARSDGESGRRLVDGGRFGKHPSAAPEGYAWVEELVGGGALARTLLERRNSAGDKTERSATPLRVLAEAATGDADASSVVDRAIEGWAYIIANCVALFDPAAIILSGGLVEEIDPFLERLRRQAAALSPVEPLIVKAELGAMGGLIGASAAALAVQDTSVRDAAMAEVRDPAARTAGAPRPLAAPALATAPPGDGAEPDQMLRDIRETPDAVRRTFAELQRAKSRRLVEDIALSRSVALLGTGASLAMVRCAEALWASAEHPSAPRKVVALEAAEALFGDSRGLVEPNAAVLIVSMSGKSPESLEAADAFRRAGNRVVAITSDGGSPLAGAASDVILTPIGVERGAATKSETTALVALLALGGLFLNDPAAVERVVALIGDVAGDESCVAAAGQVVGGARRIWTAGFGAGRGVADALALLLHEKARLSAVAGSPSDFRHGFVEASSGEDSLIVIECDEEKPLLAAYLDRLASEGQQIGLKTTWLARRDHPGLSVRLRGSTPAERTLEAVVRAQQLAHAAACAAGTYADGFKILGKLVNTRKPFA